jgi:hypothetical protein
VSRATLSRNDSSVNSYLSGNHFGLRSNVGVSNRWRWVAVTILEAAALVNEGGAENPHLSAAPKDGAPAKPSRSARVGHPPPFIPALAELLRKVL